MKNKLRTIVINNETFLYKVSKSDEYGYLADCCVTLQVYKLSYKKTPIQIYFSSTLTQDRSSPFYKGIELQYIPTGITEMISLNLPKFVRQCIEYAIKNNWHGNNSIDAIDGIAMLKKLNFDVSKISYHKYDIELKKWILTYYN